MAYSNLLPVSCLEIWRYVKEVHTAYVLCLDFVSPVVAMSTHYWLNLALVL